MRSGGGMETKHKIWGIGAREKGNMGVILRKGCPIEIHLFIVKKG